MRNKKEPLYCLKVVRTDSEGVYRSMISHMRGFDLKYTIGQKTEPKHGPVFCYQKNNAGLYAVKFYTDIRYKFLLCEYEPYDQPVPRMINPLMFDAFRADEVILFWNGETPKHLANISIDEWTGRIDVPPRAMLFAKWVKPVNLISIEDV